MNKTSNLILRYLFLKECMETLTQHNIANNQRLSTEPQNVLALSLKEKLKHDKDIIMPQLKELHDEIKNNFLPEGKEFKFL